MIIISIDIAPNIICIFTYTFWAQMTCINYSSRVTGMPKQFLYVFQSHSVCNHITSISMSQIVCSNVVSSYNSVHVSADNLRNILPSKWLAIFISKQMLILAVIIAVKTLVKIFLDKLFSERRKGSKRNLSPLP